jgi:hypothetical protein
MKTIVLIGMSALGILLWGKLQANNGDSIGVAKTQNTYHIQTTAFQSTIHFDGEHLLTISLFRSQEGQAKIQLLKNGIPVFSGKYKHKQVITEKLDLNVLEQGVYRVRIISNGEIIEKEILKKTDAVVNFE